MKKNQTFKSNFFAIMVMALFILTGVIQSAEGQDYKLTPIPLSQVRITDQFWAPRIETNRTVTMPVAFQKYEQRGHMCSPKMIEGASYSLQNHPDRELENYIGRLIDKIAALQEDDGYLHRKRDQTRWSRLSHSHELYNLGHMYEAAVAHYLATSKRTLLDVATKNADLLCEVFGPDKKRDIPGHPEIELALVKLYRVTGNEKYLKLVKFFLDERGHAHGRELYSNKGIVKYMQDHKPLVEQREAVGHAVRAVYLYSGLTDVAVLTGDSDYLKALDSIWENCVTKKLCINGGIGVRWEGEAFGDNYELPNKTAHSETCAAIANIFWNHRMSLLHGDAKYIDVLELTLYNRVLAGVSLDGSRVFYKGPLASDGRWQRPPIKDNINCCVTNVVRLIPQIGRYIFAADGDGIYVNLYIGGTGKANIEDGTVTLMQETGYPWEGAVKITLDTTEPISFDLNLRIPGWCVGSSPVWGDLYRFGDRSRQTIVIKINGKIQKNFDIKKGYVCLHRQWKSGDVVELNLPMPIRRVHCHPNVKNNVGRAAIMRGPLVYCAEGLDNDGHALNLLLTDNKKLHSEYREDLLGGVTVICGNVSALYPEEGGKLERKRIREFTMIPYYAWANRGPTEMAIWLAHDQSALKPVAPPTIASTSQVTTSHFWDKMRLHAYTIHDQLEPKSSKDRSAPQFNWWPLHLCHMALKV